MNMNTDEQQQQRTPVEEHHVHHVVNPVEDGPSPMNVVWSLILAMLTFLLVVVIVMAINMFAEEPQVDGPDGPGTTEQPGGSDTPDQPDTPDGPTVNPGPGTSDGDEKSYLISKDASAVELLSLADSGSYSGLYSHNAVLVDASDRTIVAGLEADVLIYPASMTKVMTLIVAMEQLTEEDMDQYVAMSADIVSRMQQENASGAGLEGGEELTVKDLLYAIAVESDCAASIQLAEYIAGSEEAFVQLMNDKAAEIGLFRTTFKNCTGLHDDAHVTTCRELASIMLLAMDNEDIKAMLSCEYYKTATNYYPGGRTFLSTFFSEVVGAYSKGGTQTQPSNGKVVAAKTGSTPEAGACLVSYFVSNTDQVYVMVSAGAVSSLAYVNDYIYVYENYAK